MVCRKHPRVTFSNTVDIARILSTSAIWGLWKPQGYWITIRDWLTKFELSRSEFLKIWVRSRIVNFCCGWRTAAVVILWYVFRLPSCLLHWNRRRVARGQTPKQPSPYKRVLHADYRMSSLMITEFEKRSKGIWQLKKGSDCVYEKFKFDNWQTNDFVA